MQELGESRGVWRSPWVLGDTHLRGVLVGRRGHRLGGHHRQSRCRGDMVHPGWDSHREPVGGRNSAGLRGISPWKEIPWNRRKKGTERRGDKHPSTVLHHPVPGRNPRWFDDPYHNLVIIWDLWFWIKECIRGQAKAGAGKIFPGQQPGKGRVLGDDGCRRQTSLYLLPCEPWCTQAIFSPPLMPITAVPKWGFPSLFQLFLLFGSRKTSHKCKTFHFLQLYSKKTCLSAFGHHGVTSSSTACSIQKGHWASNVELTDVVDSYVALANPVDSYVELTDPMAIECTEMRKENLSPCLIWTREQTLILTSHMDIPMEPRRQSETCHPKLSWSCSAFCKCIVIWGENRLFFGIFTSQGDGEKEGHQEGTNL